MPRVLPATMDGTRSTTPEATIVGAACIMVTVARLLRPGLSVSGRPLGDGQAGLAQAARN